MKVNSSKCKSNPDECCYEKHDRAAANFGFMCKKGTCNRSTGICDQNIESFILGSVSSIFSFGNIEGFSLAPNLSCDNYQTLFWILLFVVIVLLVLLYKK